MEKNKRKRKMFISVLPGEQVEMVVAEEGAVKEYYVDMLHQDRTKGNIYKGVVSNIDVSLQAAFINYGAEKNGFLQIDEVHPEYYRVEHDSTKGRRFPLLQKALKNGQELLVQVVKEPAGSKGAFLTTYLSLPGRYVVLTPGREQIGVSRKVEDDQERAELKKLVESLEPGEGMGVIVRTASLGQNKTSLSKDLQFLKRLWKEIRAKGTEEKPPTLIYKEPDLAVRAVRDYLTEDVSEVWVDDKDTADQVSKFAALIFPRRPGLVKLHQDPERTLWERFNLQRQFEQIYSREVILPSGGRMVIDHTEALTAVDVNSGKTTVKANFEAMALQTNLEAAETLAQQLRLRDIGGQIVVDFIELKDRAHCQDVEKTMRQALKNDRARFDVGKMTRFGLMQIVRQRLGSSALSLSTEPCPCCNGTGIRRNMEWQAMQALKDLHRLLRRPGLASPLEYKAPAEVADYLLNEKRDKLVEMERQAGVSIRIHPE